MRILIAGAGVGGIVSALLLRQYGYDVQVFEQADGNSEIGAGVQLSPNAMRVLMQLGLYHDLAPLATEPHAATIRHHKTGAIYTRQVLRHLCRVNYKAPYFQFFRPDLMRVLLTAAHKAGVQINFGEKVSGYHQDAQAAYLQLQSTRAPAGDIIIAADGLHSPIRAQMLGDSPLRFGGVVAWRGVIEARLVKGQLPFEATLWAGKGKHFVAYYMQGAERYMQGAERINFVAVQRMQKMQKRSHHSDTNNYSANYSEGDNDELREAFAGWHSPVQNILAAAQHSTLWDLYDRPPSSTICDGRIALLGDAAHPTLPFAAQGAAMAIEDANVIAHTIKNHNRAQGAQGAQGKNYNAIALLTYQKIRKPRTAYITKTSRRALSLYHSAPPLKQAAFAYPALLRQQMKRIYGYDPLL